MKLGFVILHYKTYEMTCECIEHLLHTFDGQDYQIVVVDNGSGNGSGEKLLEVYVADQHIDVLLNPDNLGFANGNNTGYRFIKEKYSPDFIIVMNNDVLIKDNEFGTKIENIYQNSKFAVLGPDIQNPILKNHQNPERMRPRSYEEVKTRYLAFKRRSERPRFYYLLSVIRRMFKGKQTTAAEGDYQNEREDVVLHGACYIFSSDFWKKRDDCFNISTFLYHEEDILYYECKRDNLKMLYSPEIYVEHLEDVSTNASFTSEFTKTKARNKWLRDSAKVLLDIMAEDRLGE